MTAPRMLRAIGLAVLVLLGAIGTVSAQVPATDANTPLHLLKPDLPGSLRARPAGADHRGAPARPRLPRGDDAGPDGRPQDRPGLADLATAGAEPAIDPGAFRVTSYEWGVVYSGMLLAAETTGDPAFNDYVARRLALVAALADHYRAHPLADGPLRSVLEPRALDDAGSLCAAMIKAARAGVAANLRPMIDRFIALHREQRSSGCPTERWPATARSPTRCGSTIST